MSATPEAGPTKRGGRGARERILKASVELFARDGIHATGIAKVTEVAHVSTRTLYQHFPSKEALVSAYLERLESDPNGPAEIETVLTRDDLEPRDRLIALFATPAGDALAGPVLRGCPFHNTAVEAAGGMADAAAFVERHKRELIANLIATADAAGAENPEALGRQLAVLFEGARALATSVNDAHPFEDARELAVRLIDDAVGGMSSG
ncbi:regulatory protein TetR [Pseudonocardia dioxanivorans CB1190]|uniref:Regulatory protein TetR n=1 Tax=Pseudonocardia dioxanivorans (strain ATCC 55486 / DSM 44775 / JCM 13855 / CB1190) TaxID=675635 RepID=F4CTI9_PSEUX|nr:TetR/AcrR family transcriptional regulator [Pseudonocardia dioxanivorans]AEA28492.1 regulatory protein TetR [Pseudonocardia dioxanivorans CB1190]